MGRRHTAAAPREILLSGDLPHVPLEEPTWDTLKKEAALLGDQFVEVSTSPADLVADADEMLEAAADLADLKARGYRVSEGLLTRIRLLRDAIAPAHAEGARKQAVGKATTEAFEKARVRLLQLRSQLADIGHAANLPASLFSFGSNRTNRLNVVMMRMEEILENVATFEAQLPDQARVARLVTEARGLLDQVKELRRTGQLMRADRSQGTANLMRLERLLLDALQYLSAQGLAAYPDDPARAARYRLDHLYGRRPSKVGDPGAGGTDGQPDGEPPGAAAESSAAGR